MPKTRRTEAKSPNKTERKQLRAIDSRQDDVVQVCFETPDSIWLSIKELCPDIMELQEFVTMLLDRAAPKKDLSRACLDLRHPVPAPPVYQLENRVTKVRCFKTPRPVWTLMVMWAAISGNDLKELISGILWAYVERSSKSARRKKMNS